MAIFNDAAVSQQRGFVCLIMSQHEMFVQFVYEFVYDLLNNPYRQLKLIDSSDHKATVTRFSS